MGDNRFYFRDGSWANNLEQLSEKLEYMSEEEFTHHVNPEKNDFATWAELSLDKKEIADKIRICNTKEQIQEVLGKKNEKKEEKVNEVTDLPPPTPPTGGQNTDNNGSENNQKKGFFKGLFSKKDEKPRVNVVSGETELHYDINAEHSENEVPQLDEQDIQNLKEALGLSDNKKSIQEDFENKVEEEQRSKPEKKEKEEKHNWTSSPEELPVFEKKQAATAQEPETRKEAVKAIVADKKEEFNKELETAVEEVNQNKEDIVDEKKQQALLKAFDSKIRKIVNNYKTQLNKQMNQKKQIHTKEAAKIDKKEDSLNTKYEKLKAKEESVEKQLAQMKKDAEKYKSLKEMKAELEETIEDLAETKDEADLKRKELDSQIKEKQKQLDKMDRELTQAEGKLQDATKKSEEILKKLKMKEETLRQKEAKVKSLLQQEKKIYEKLGTLKVEPAPMKKTPDNDFSAELEDEINLGTEFETEKTDDASVLKERIKDCKQMIDERNFEDAKLLYNELTQEFKQLNVQGEEKEKYKHELRELYDEICLKIMSR